MALSDELRDPRLVFGDNFSTHQGGSQGNNLGTRNLDLALNQDDPMGQAGNNAYLADVARRRNLETGGANNTADISQYQIGGAGYVPQRTAGYDAMAMQLGNRAAPTTDYGQANAALGNAGSAALMTAGQGNLLNQAATGAGYQGQLGAANALMGLAQQPAGPSVAELAMRQQAGAAMQQQQALAAGARGGNAALALQNAAQNQAGISGTLNQNLGVQRAQEDMANRQFQANAIGAAGNAFGNAAGTQVNALGAATGAYGSAGQQAQGIAGQFGQQAQFGTQTQLAQQGQNDAQRLAYLQQSQGLQQAQTTNNAAFDQNRTQNDLQLYGIQRGNEGKQSTAERVGGAAIQAGATIGSMAAMMSDMRAKKDARPASGDVSDAFRAADQNAAAIRGTQVAYPDLGGEPTPYDAIPMPAGVAVRGRAPVATFPVAAYTGPPAGSRRIDYGGGSSATSVPWAGSPPAQPAPPATASGHGSFFATPRGMTANAGEYGPSRDQMALAYGIRSLGALGPQISDVRAKRDIAPAPGAVSEAFRMPSAGYMPGEVHLNPDLAPAVPRGAARPFSPGEYVRNPDGSWSSEVSMTVDNPRLNGGRPTVIPSMWLKNGKPYIARDEDEAARMAMASGLPFRSFGSMPEAEQFSIDRESQWQPLERPEDAKTISPLWAQPKRVAPTDLMFSADNGGTFRTPEEQYQYQLGVRNPQPTIEDFRRAHRDESTRTVPTLDAFRAAHFDESNRPLYAPAYSYEYKNPKAVGATPGVKYGPMAQDLEKTPAGASVVGTDKSGKKFVDPGRLSMLTASEVSKQRQELDALQGQIASIGQAQVAYPTPTAPPGAFGWR